ncbi:MAG: BON domain-containing protein [Burkholderiales bacterium]|nr:BON domain-containing protein [Burkholderiales bacterium]
MSTTEVQSISLITQQVKRKLEEDMVASKIAVETTNGVVILSGFSKSEAISQGAIATVRSIEGVKTVKSAMAVVKF